MSKVQPDSSKQDEQRTGRAGQNARGRIERGAFSEWARRIRDSDRKAFAELFDAMSDRLVHYARGITRDEASAYDVLQDVFLKVWERRQQLNPDSSLQSLLYTMTRNASLNVNRRKGYLVTDEHIVESGALGLKGPAVSSEEELDAKNLSEHIHQWIEELPQRRREAFVLSRRHDMTHKEISEIMGLSERTVNTHIFLALKHLRSKLDALQKDRV